MTSNPGILENFASMKVLVLGDLMLDTYVNGRSQRLCPEAPVPVIDYETELNLPGGAGNTAVNLARLGASVRFSSVCGDDDNFLLLRRLLEQEIIDTSGIIPEPARSTLQKTRVMAGSQLMCRLDRGSTSQIDAAVEDRLIASLEILLDGVDGLVISDYGKGLLTTRVIDFLSRERQKRSFFLAVDSKNLRDWKALTPDLVKPNFQEAQALLQVAVTHSNRLEKLGRMGEKLYELSGATRIALSLDEDGALLFVYGMPAGQIRAKKVDRPWVSGAGDTYIAAASLALMGGAGFEAAAEIAGAAASLVLSSESNSSPDRFELRRLLTKSHKLVHSQAALESLCREYHKKNLKIVFTNGCFDILHSGHVGYLEEARKLGDVLVVGLNSDESIKRLKGEGRPVNGVQDRVKVLSGLSSVDHIICFGTRDDDTPIPLIPLVRPQVFVKGGDYSLADLPEATLVEACGGRIEILPYLPGRSTTETIQRMQNVQGSTSHA